MAARRLSCSSSRRSSQSRASAPSRLPAASLRQLGEDRRVALAQPVRLRRARRPARRRTRESSRASRSAAGRRTPSRWRTRLFSTSDVTRSSGSPSTSSVEMRSIASRLAPPTKTDSVANGRARARRAGRGSRRSRRAASAGAREGPARRRTSRRRPIVEPGEHRLRGQDPRPRRRELDRQRQPVEAHADLGHGRRVLVGHLERRVDRPGALDEQRHRLELRELRQRREVGRVGQPQRRHRVLLLAGDAQDDPAARRPACSAGHARTRRLTVPRGVEHLLEVVEHEERRPLPDVRRRSARGSSDRRGRGGSSVVAMVGRTSSGSVIEASSTKKTPPG